MHQLNVLILGPASFTATLNELEPFLKFNSVKKKNSSDFDVILFHEEALKNKEDKRIIINSNRSKICSSNNQNLSNKYDAFLEIPSSLKEINITVENVAAKKIFSKNSSIQIKKYLLNKNEKKLSNINNEIILTEKEIQLLELFLNNKKPISKDKILSSVWNYSSDADTHTVETHIYRLRKKINDKFSDENFIVNTKDGYSL
jgi:DNA-binding response OmpR family regulator